LTAANQSTVGKRQDRFLAHNHALHGLHLGHMVIIGSQFTPLDTLVDAHQEVSGDVLTIVNPSQVLDEVI